MVRSYSSMFGCKIWSVLVGRRRSGVSLMETMKEAVSVSSMSHARVSKPLRVTHSIWQLSSHNLCGSNNTFWCACFCFFGCSEPVIDDVYTISNKYSVDRHAEEKQNQEADTRPQAKIHYACAPVSMISSNIGNYYWSALRFPEQAIFDSCQMHHGLTLLFAWLDQC